MKINKLVSFILSLCMLFTITSCSTFCKTMPEDFHFEITWGAFGSSYYNSETGELIKKKDENIQTTYFMGEENLRKVYDIIFENKIYKINKLSSFGFLFSDPAGEYEITIYANNEEKVITAPYGADISRSPYTIKAYRFAIAIEKIRSIICESEEWKALKDPEYWYM